MSGSGSGGNLAYGLNSRKAKKRKRNGPIDILGGGGGGGESDDESDDDNNDAVASADGRVVVNREIAAEQAALRRRAEAAMAAKRSGAAVGTNEGGADGMYDYDAEYDSFASSSGRVTMETTGRWDNNKDDDATSKAVVGKAKPRYIADLMRTAQRRNQEHEVVHERKLIREQAADENPEYEGKETFVTSSYRRKMEERERWAREEEERTKREEEEDARLKERRGGGMPMGNFMFGIVGRNLLMEKGENRGIGGNIGVGDDKGGDEEKNLVDRNEGDHRNGTKSNLGVDDDPGDASFEYSDRDGVARGGDAACANRDGDFRDRERESSAERERERVRPSPPPPSSSFTNGMCGNSTAPVAAVAARTAQEEEDVGGAKNEKKSRRQILVERAKKIRDARKRYFERRGRVGGVRTATMAM